MMGVPGVANCYTYLSEEGYFLVRNILNVINSGIPGLVNCDTIQ